MIEARIVVGVSLIGELTLDAPGAGLRELATLFPHARAIVPAAISNRWVVVLDESHEPGPTRITKEECPLCRTGSILNAASAASRSEKHGSSPAQPSGETRPVASIFSSREPRRAR